MNTLQKAFVAFVLTLAVQSSSLADTLKSRFYDNSRPRHGESIEKKDIQDGRAISADHNNITPVSANMLYQNFRLHCFYHEF